MLVRKSETGCQIQPQDHVLEIGFGPGVAVEKVKVRLMMSEIFTRTFHIGWADVDINGHMKNTAYMEKAIDVRLLYFEDQGFPMSEFQRLQLGPVVRRDEIEYFRELRLLEQVTINLTLAGISEDASRFRLRSEFFRADGKLAAKLSTTGGWLNLTARKLALPPPALAAALQRLSRSEDFEPLPSSIRPA